MHISIPPCLRQFALLGLMAGMLAGCSTLDQDRRPTAAKQELQDRQPATATQERQGRQPATDRQELWNTVRARQAEANGLMDCYASIKLLGVRSHILAVEEPHVRMEGEADSSEAIDRVRHAVRLCKAVVGPERVEVASGSTEGSSRFIVHALLKQGDVATASIEQGAERRGASMQSYFETLLFDINNRALAEGLAFQQFMPTKVRGLRGYTELPVKLRLSGPVTGLRNFVAGLAARREPVVISNIRLEDYPRVKGDTLLTADLFVLMER